MIDGLSLRLRLVVVYRPPYSAAHPVTSSTFFPEFSEYLESLVLSKVPICIYGDFNVHLDVSDDADTIAFADLLESLCLTQHVKSPTHVMGHILDLIITRSSDNIIKGTPSPDSFLSDHCSVWCCLNVMKVLATVKHISFRKLKSLDLVLKTMLLVVICATSVQMIVMKLQSCITTICTPFWIVMHR